MLAYVFWHVPLAESAAGEYESALRNFHEVLWRARVKGFVGERVFRLDTIPWLTPQAPGYEDWHLLEDSAALDLLNESAVNGHRQLPHDRIAALAGSGTAGLYGLRLGQPIEPTQAHWMSKPAGMSYRDFYASMKPAIDAGCSLWGRRMTLGPTPEFCLHAPVPLIPPPQADFAMQLETVLSHGFD